MDDMASFPSSSSSNSAAGEMNSMNLNAADQLISAITHILAGSTQPVDLDQSTAFFPAPSTSKAPPMEIMAADDQQPVLDTWRVPPSLFAVFVIFYAAVFFCGLVGNTFVCAAIAMNKSLRTATDWLISSLALADLLILVFCLPSTLLNNLLTEWQLGSFGCKLSVWVNSTTSCASIFTLVGVTADRYMAICHPLKQLKMKNSLLHFYILGIWLLSGLLASPNLWLYREILYDLLSGAETTEEAASNEGAHRLVARLCVDTSENIWLFISINLFIAFLVPIIIICVLYALIFRAVSKHTKKKLAVDNGARQRDERVKLRIAQMMFTVIVVFVLCWTPLYGLYCYFFMAENRDSAFFQFASSVLRPIFQWLSLLSSSLNPLIYIAFSQKYRRAFQHLLLLPCRKRYQKFQRATRNTFRLSSAFSEKPSTAQLLSSHHHANGHLPLSNGPSSSSILFVNQQQQRPRCSLDATLSHSLSQRKVSFSNCQPPSAQRRKMSEQVTGRSQSAIVRQKLEEIEREQQQLKAQSEPVGGGEKKNSTVYRREESRSPQCHKRAAAEHEEAEGKKSNNNMATKTSSNASSSKVMDSTTNNISSQSTPPPMVVGTAVSVKNATTNPIIVDVGQQPQNEGKERRKRKTLEREDLSLGQLDTILFTF